MNSLGMIAIGIGVGLLIGLTGMGSGSLLTPLLILIGGLSPATAVGTSLALSFATKLYGSWSFYRRGLVRLDIVRDLSLGGVPGVVVGALVIRYLGLHRPQMLNFVLSRAIGLVMIAVALIMLIRLLPLHIRPAGVDRPVPLALHWRRMLIVLIGMCVGLSVAVTSIGSGAALIPAMVLFYALDSGTLVGTNVFMGAILAALALVPHARLGHVDWKAAAALLCGSVPAVWLSSKIHGGVPRQVAEGIIAGALMLMGFQIMTF